MVLLDFMENRQVSGQFHQSLKDPSTPGHGLLRLKLSRVCLDDLFFVDDRRDELSIQQVCIPVGSVLPTACPWEGEGSAFLWGDLPSERGLYSEGGVRLSMALWEGRPPCGQMTDASKNITLPHTSGGN